MGFVKESLRWATMPGLMFGEGMYDLCGWLAVPSVPARARPLTFGVALGVEGRDRAVESDRWCVLAAEAGRDDTEPERP